MKMLEKLKIWERAILYSERGLRTGWRALLFIGYLEVYGVIFFLASLFLLALFAALVQRPPSPQEAFMWFVLSQGALALPTIHIARWMFRRFERRPLASLGLLLHRHAFKEFATGFALGAVIAGSASLYLYASGTVHLSWNPIGWSSALALSLVGSLGWLGVAFWEEFYFRGYLLQTLIQGMGLYGAMLLTSVLFGLVHIATYGVTPLAVTDAALYGFVLALLYLKTRSLWGPIGMHFANNFVSAHLLPIPIETVIRGFPLLKINEQPVQFEVPRLLFQVEIAEGKSLLGWEILGISLVAYALVILVLLKAPGFRPHPEMEALWQQYVQPAQSRARLRAR